MMKRQPVSSERGAILVHVAIGALVLIAVNTFVFDYGLMWLARRQAQNGADSGALAGAVAMAFDANGWTDRTETGPARSSAHKMAQLHLIVGEVPNVSVTTDVFFTGTPAAMCPPDPDGNFPCIRVDVYRNQARGNPLPAIFGAAVGITEHGVRATATARVAVADASDCMKPWAIPDKWNDIHDITPTIDTVWTPDDTFDTHSKKGSTYTPLANPDVYVAPTTSNPGTGFTATGTPNNLGMEMTLKYGNPQDAIAPGVFFPVRIPRYDGVSTGGADYRDNIASCNGIPIEIGTTLQSENGNMIGPTNQGVEDLIDLDPNADWDPVANAVINSCAQSSTPCGGHSPRIVAIPVFDPSAYYAGKMNGQTTFVVVNILGFFIDRIVGNDVVGYLTEAPGLSIGTAAINPQSSFLKQIQLVR